MFHAAATIMAEFDDAGFTYLPEGVAWDIEPGGCYYTQRNTSSVIAFKVGEDLAATWGEDDVAGDYHFQLAASHSDSPTFKVKAVPDLDGAGETLRLNTEAYGGMIDYTWFDRPLVLAGRVLVRHGAQKTSSQETNQNLCASRTARMYTQPMLEIYADDVKCAHGSTVGQLNDAALFYMRQRGISLDEARLLLEFAFINEVIDTIRLEPLKDRLHYLVEKRFRGELNKCEGCKLCH